MSGDIAPGRYPCSWMKATAWDEISLQFHSTQWRVIITHLCSRHSSRPWVAWVNKISVRVAGRHASDAPLRLFLHQTVSAFDSTIVCYLSLGLQSFSAQDLTLSSSVNVDPESRTWAVFLQSLRSTTVLWLVSWAISCPQGPMPPSPWLLYLCSLAGLDLSGITSYSYTWQPRWHPLIVSLISVGQKSRHTLAAQVLMDLNRCQWAAFSSAGRGLLPSSFRWLSELSSLLTMHPGCHARSKRSLPVLVTRAVCLQSQQWELLTQQTLLLQIFQLWSFLREGTCPFKGSCDEVKLHEDNLMFSVNCARWHNLITEAISHPLHRFLPLHDRGDYTRMGLLETIL